MILNCREIFENKVTKARLLTLFETAIRKIIHISIKTREERGEGSLLENLKKNEDKGCILTVFGTAEKTLKTKTVNGAF